MDHVLQFCKKKIVIKLQATFLAHSVQNKVEVAKKLEDKRQQKISKLAA